MAYFATTRNEPGARPMRRVYDGGLKQTNIDHPLFVPDAAPHGGFDFEGARRPAPGPAPSHFAGHKTMLSTPVRTVLTGVDGPAPGPSAPFDRHEYKHPTYSVSRSQNGSSVKDLLYGGGAPAPAPAPKAAAAAPTGPPGHPLSPYYNELAYVVPQLSKDEDGSTDAAKVKQVLDMLELPLSVDGFAEFLARCDVSPMGIPPFDDFVLCVSRPARDAPPEPTSMGGPAALPAHMANPPPSQPAEAPQQQGGVADYATAEPPPPPAAPPQEQQPPAQQQQTWGVSNMVADLARAKEHVQMPLPGAQPSGGGAAAQGQTPVVRQAFNYVGASAAGGNFPLGVRSQLTPLGANMAPMYAKNLKGQAHASSQKFTNSFNPDFFVL